METFSYDAKEVTVIIGVILVQGFAPDTKVVVDRDEDAFTKRTGTDGDTTRSKSNNKGGSFEITLEQSSPTNALFTALADLDEATGKGIVPGMVKDNSGNSVHSTRACWVKKRPTATYGAESTDRVWVFDTGELKHSVNGNNPVGG